MIQKNTSKFRTSVFHFSKSVEYGQKLACDVVMMPLHEFNRCSYTFSVCLSKGVDTERETVEDVTVSINEAERIFNLLCTHNVYPCHLYDVISDLIA